MTPVVIYDAIRRFAGCTVVLLANILASTPSIHLSHPSMRMGACTIHEPYKLKQWTTAPVGISLLQPEYGLGD